MRVHDGPSFGAQRRAWLTVCVALSATVAVALLLAPRNNDPLVSTRPPTSADKSFRPNSSTVAAKPTTTLQSESLPRRASTPAFAVPPARVAALPPPAVQPGHSAQESSPVAGAPRVADERVVFRTVAGDMVFALYPDVAPETVARVLRLVRFGAYDTTHFGALEPGFYLQLFNTDERLSPLTDAAEQALKSPGLVNAEPSRLPHRRGTLSMPPAPEGSVVSAFSIMLGDAPHVDGRQTVFGYVEAGLDVLDRLERMPRWNGTQRPAVRLTVLQAEVVSAKDLPGLVLEGPRPVEDVLDQAPLPALAARARTLLKDRCVRCHQGAAPAGGLDLASQKGLFCGGKHGPAVYRGNGLSSPLRVRVTAADKSAMPREGPQLSVAEVALLTAWIDAGAEFGSEAAVAVTDFSPRTVAPGRAEKQVSVPTKEAALWSLAPLRKVPPPAVRDTVPVQNRVDRFLLAPLEAKGLTYNASADPRTLVRRLAFGLTGLPPTPEEVEAFAADPSPGAYDRLVDRLLASPHFGEHLGRDWLDLARYADSGGYEDDDDRPLAYPYRDFVIRAFNDDLPFDTFLRWQIAGDELEPDNRLALAATGFATAGPLQTFFPRKRDRYDELDDIVSTVGSAMLGLTVGCARCHDHKYDPIPTREYYRLQAVFAASRREERTLAPDDGTELRRQIDYFTREASRLERSLREAALERKLSALSISEAEKARLRRPTDPADAGQADLLRRFGSMLAVSDADLFPDADDRKSLSRLTAQLDELKGRKQPKALTLAGSGYGRAFFLERGDPDREREAVPPGFLTALTPHRPTWDKHSWERWAPRTPDRPVPQPRRALANWLTDVDGGAGRLAARVIVNRLWQHHFGEGLVRTPNDFGAQGDRPSHPELLDWLAGELVAGGWHLKPIHRLLVTSAAYRQDANIDPAKASADPENRLVGRRRPQRLTAEALRDALLSVSGCLNREMYGPGVKPPIPAEAIFPTAPKHGDVWPADAEDGPATWRRSVYVVTKRSNPVPFLQSFDAPDTAASCGRRGTTTVPTQALILMNDPFVVGQARRFAERVRAAAGESPPEQVNRAIALAYGRPPRAAEAETAVQFLRGHSLADLCQVLVQSNEFAFID